MASLIEGLSIINQNLKFYKDFPIEGVNYLDLQSLLLSPIAFRSAINIMKESMLISGKPDRLVAMDARGFLLASPIALDLDIPLVLARKKGKLPGECYEVEYALEYGNACVEIEKSALVKGEEVAIIDDIAVTFGYVAKTYGFPDADLEELVATRYW